MKKCFKCGQEKPRSEFYAHPQMGDGLLGKCKECTKNDTKQRHLQKMSDWNWVESELERHRKKAAKYREMGKAHKGAKDAQSKWRKRNPEKAKAHFAVAKAVSAGIIKKSPCEVCGAEDTQAHHEDYSKPLAVMWLCPKHHGARHTELNRLERVTAFLTKSLPILTNRRK